MYLAKGQRTYADRNINSPEAGYLIPLVNFIPDVEALRGVGHATPPGELAAIVERHRATQPPRFDFVYTKSHGCPGLTLTDEVIASIQRDDPRPKN